jgi:hypothetical protein
MSVSFTSQGFLCAHVCSPPDIARRSLIVVLLHVSFSAQRLAESKQLTTVGGLTTKIAVDLQEFKSTYQLHKPRLTLRLYSFSAGRFGSSLMFGRKIAPHSFLLAL